MTVEEWQESMGLSTEIGWSVALPEFEGGIEPIMIGAGKKKKEITWGVFLSKNAAQNLHPEF